MTSSFNEFLEAQQEEISNNITAGRLKCDFCGVNPVSHRLPIEGYREKQTMPDGRILLITHEPMHWATCDGCARWLDPFDMNGLILYLFNTMPLLHNTRQESPYIAQILEQSLRASYYQLQEHISGRLEKIT